MKKKKIGFYYSSLYTLGGIQRVVTNIINGLCEDYDIKIIANFDPKEKIDYGLNEKIKTEIIRASFIEKSIIKIFSLISRFINIDIRWKNI